MSKEKQWPLKGVKVLDLGQIYNGPYAGFLLAHAGADVIKLEPLQGEVLRQRGGGVIPLSFAMLNTNKRGIAINLKEEKGKEILIKLVKEADVLLENFAPNAMERLGLGSKVLTDVNPRLIYASGSGYGLSGPEKDNFFKIYLYIFCTLKQKSITSNNLFERSFLILFCLIS